MMQRVVNVETKADLKSSAMVRNLDACYPKSHYFSHIIFLKTQTQRFNTKKSKLEEFKPKKSKLANIKTSATFYPNFTEPRKTSYQDKKKKYF